MMKFFSNIFRRDSPSSLAEENKDSKSSSSSDKMNLNNLSSMARNVTQNHGTEPPFSSPLNNNKLRGLYTCIVCNTPVFSSDHKFDSGTGWPSFYSPYTPANIGTKQDYSVMSARTEVHCARCNAHFGHVFNDGPMPTGLRYCINGAALNFTPQ